MTFWCKHYSAGSGFEICPKWWSGGDFIWICDLLPFTEADHFHIYYFQILDISRFVQCALCTCLHMSPVCCGWWGLCAGSKCVLCRAGWDRICNSAGPSYLQRLTQGEAYHAALAARVAGCFKRKAPWSNYQFSPLLIKLISHSRRWRQ